MSLLQTIRGIQPPFICIFENKQPSSKTKRYLRSLVQFEAAAFRYFCLKFSVFRKFLFVDKFVRLSYVRISDLGYPYYASEGMLQLLYMVVF